MTRSQVLSQDGEAQIYSGTWAHRAVVKDGRVIGKSRYAPRGFEERAAGKAFYEAPTAAMLTHRLCEVVGLALCWDGFNLDFKRAFFQGKAYPDDSWEAAHVWIEEPSDYQVDGERTPKALRRCRRLLKDVPGLRRAPLSWHKRMTEVLLQTGHVRSRVDSALFLHMDASGNVDGLFPSHVDDCRGRGTAEYVQNVVKQVTSILEVGTMEFATHQEVMSGAQTRRALC